MLLHVLHLEDDALDREIVADALKKEGFELQITPATRKHEFLEGLERERFDVILSDYVLPGYSGGEAFAAARSMAPETPFIFVSGRMPEEIAIEKLRLGAT